MKKIGVLAGFVAIIFSCGKPGGEEQTGNHLVHETSPYLLQHAYNPVNWYPWGEEVLEKAQQEEKPIIISIGYAACHWCHVMEEESFEDDSVAAFMNQNFVNIKIDREERPDIDQIYMEAAQLMTGSGGWPLNVITMPDGKPFFAGTYFPRDDWMNILRKVAEMYQDNPAKLQQVADQVTEGIRNNEISSLGVERSEFKPELADQLFQTWKAGFDTIEGGYNRAPKFPMPVSFQAVLTYAHLTGSQPAYEQVEKTLDKIAAGGIYDHLGGGFARYSTDKFWKVPHFEKMLYDNAQLLSLYAQAYKVTGKAEYHRVINETTDFLQREMRDESGGFYSSFDADSEGEEGTFYVWSSEELKALLSQDSNLFFEFYNISDEGNWEERKNILFRNAQLKEIALKYELTEQELKNKISQLRKKLFEERQKRPKPGLDDKILTAWNALMVRGMLDAYEATGEAAYLDQALETGNFILNNQVTSDRQVFRNYKNGQTTIPGFLDDYAYTIRAFIDLYQATFDESWLQAALEINEKVENLFYDPEKGFYYYTSDNDPELIARKIEIYDNVMPSSNSVMAENLFLLGQFYYQPHWIERAEQMLQAVLPEMKQSPEYFGNWFQMQLFMTYPFYEIAIVGPEFNKMKAEMNQNYLPNSIFLGGKDEGSLELLDNKLVEGQTNIYVCIQKACKFPVQEPEKALSMISSKTK